MADPLVPLSLVGLGDADPPLTKLEEDLAVVLGLPAALPGAEGGSGREERPRPRRRHALATVLHLVDFNTEREVWGSVSFLLDHVTEVVEERARKLFLLESGRHAGIGAGLGDWHLGSCWLVKVLKSAFFGEVPLDVRIPGRLGIHFIRAQGIFGGTVWLHGPDDRQRFQEFSKQSVIFLSG